MAIQLFNTRQETLPSVFDHIVVDDLSDYFDTVIYQRGIEYYESGQVKNVDLAHNFTSLSAVVKGTKKYSVQLSVHEGNLWGNCNCPYQDTCKHIAAVLLYFFNSQDELKIEQLPDKKESVRNHLYSLTKEDLIVLVEKYAPSSFFNTIRNQYSDTEEALRTFQKTHEKIKKMFVNTDLLYSPADFEETLNKQLMKLKGLEKHLYKEIQSLLLFIIKEIEKAYDEGYLYVDGYYEDYFHPELFEEFAIQFISNLPFKEKITYINQLEEIISMQSYDIFTNILSDMNKFFEIKETDQLKELILTEVRQIPESLLGKYYAILHNHLTEKEKESLLLQIKNQDADTVKALASLYQRSGRIDEAIDCLEKYMHKDTYSSEEESIYILYLELLSQSGKLLAEKAEQVIKKHSSIAILKKIVALLPEKSGIFEKYLEDKNPDELLDYYESSNRLSEALALIKRAKTIFEKDVSHFFKKHRKQFPLEAEKYFSKLIKQNLKNTGDHYYASIADSLAQIKKINPILANVLAQDIRSNYKRRTKLMTMISMY